MALLAAMVRGSAACSSAESAATSADGGAPSDARDVSDLRDAAVDATEPVSTEVKDAGAPESDAEADTGPPSVQIVGRVDARDPAGPRAAWPGVVVRARFLGSSASVTFDEAVAGWMTGAPSEWDVMIDGAAQPKLVTTAGLRTYSLATNLGPGPHLVELARRSEAQNGITQVQGFDFGAGGQLLSPPRRAGRRIEVIGDSTVAGFGVEGVGYAGNDCPGPDHAARWQDFGKTWGSLVARTFGAEVHGVAYSGKGLVKNVWRPDTQTMPLLYGRSNPLDGTSTWSPASFVPDVVVVMIGANDFNVGAPDEVGPNAPATVPEFETAYRGFVSTLRSAHPAAHLFLAISPTISDVFPAGRNIRTNVKNTVTMLAAERAAAGDARVHAFEPGAATGTEGTGCAGHASPALHARIATELAAAIGAKLGW